MLEKPKPKQPLQVNCYVCNKSITVKHVRRLRNYSQKNNWGFWTEREEYKSRYICNDCLVKLYKQCKWEFKLLISSKRKQSLLRQYITDGDISGEFETFFTDDEHIEECLRQEKSHSKPKKKKK